MNALHVIVAATERDLSAAGLAAAVARRDDMTLVEGRSVGIGDVDRLLARGSAAPHAAVLVSRGEAEDDVADWLQRHPELVVLCKDIVGDAVRFELRGMGLDGLLTALGQLSAARLGALELPRGTATADRPRPRAAEASAAAAGERPLLGAALGWVHAVLEAAVVSEGRRGDDAPGLTLAAETLGRVLAERAPTVAPTPSEAVVSAERALFERLGEADPGSEPLAALSRQLALSDLEWKFLLLALAPELDVRYQRCFGLMQDDLGRRTGSFVQLATLLGEPVAVRRALAATGGLERWRLIGVHSGGPAHGDEPLQVDPALVRWLLGDATALASDPAVARLLIATPWGGSGLLRRPQDRVQASNLLDALRTAGAWIALTGASQPHWRALLELGAQERREPLVRIDLARASALDRSGAGDAAWRIGRLVCLTQRALVIDAGAQQAAEIEAGRAFCTELRATGARAALLVDRLEDTVRLAGSGMLAVHAAPESDAGGRESMFRAAAHDVGTTVDDEQARAAARLFPLDVDALERATALVRSQPGPADPGAVRDRLYAACRSIAAEGISRLARRIQPAFELDDVVLPPDRKAQLAEVVANVSLSARVLVDWRFGEKLPYGRGVSALFHGPSGTGKTMAAQGIAQALGIELYALDLSRVVSKYIGDTEKNIDTVFSDAQRSGAAILIDEADALLGKRSEVKDAHDRYANIEVAFLLQRMEAFEGLAILTTNLRQNLDAAFLRRLRFLIDFPRPDADARSAIWKACLPDGAHSISAETLRQLGRRIDLTGGHIRQITLRAAFLAAAEGRSIDLEHIQRAARAELAKLGMSAVALDLPEARRAA
jgi:AAA+ superfamily predicted ATPase